MGVSMRGSGWAGFQMTDRRPIPTPTIVLITLFFRRPGRDSVKFRAFGGGFRAAGVAVDTGTPSDCVGGWTGGAISSSSTLGVDDCSGGETPAVGDETPAVGEVAARGIDGARRTRR